MYYNRKLEKLSGLLEKNGPLRWLFNYVKDNCELDFLIGKNKSKEWISVYRGLTRIFTILSTNNPSTIFIDADKKYKNLHSTMFGEKTVNNKFIDDIEELLTLIKNDAVLDRYYKNAKEGFFQNELSRRYGLCGNENDEFVIIDKEVVIGYSDQNEKNNFLIPFREKYKNIQKQISALDAKRYGKDLEKKPIGNELDFLALDKQGNILLIEYKHGTNTSGIYLSPLQIGMYYDIFTQYPKSKLVSSILQMLDQKQKIGLINPYWKKPDYISEIIPVLIISEYNYASSAKCKFNEILNITRKNLGQSFLSNVRTFNYTSENGLSEW